MKREKFTVNDFHTKYPDDDACLDELFRSKYGNKTPCPSCNKEAHFYKVTDRKCYSCEHCGYQIHPLADTIFHKSSTSLKNWFFAIFLFANSRNGVAAKELERQLGVTYKCAWRIAKQIRLLFQQSKEPLSNTVEVDETYVGGKSSGTRGRGAKGKTSVVGIVERQAEVRAKVTANTKSSTVLPLIRENVKIGTRVITDEYLSYNRVSENGYTHDRIKHISKQYVLDDIHTNTIEGFWSQLKRSLHGTHHAVSPKYLQHYVDEFAYRYNQRNAFSHLFHGMVLKAQQPVL